MRVTAISVSVVLLLAGGARHVDAQSSIAALAPADAPLIDQSDPSGARRFLADPGELVTLYGSRRFDPYYEPGRQPPATDPETGWPLAPFMPVGGALYSPYAYRYSPYGYGFYRSYYRPWYVPYGYGYGWGHRYPFGYYPWYANRYQYYRPWYDRYQPGLAHGAYDWHSPHVDYGPSFLDIGLGAAPHAEYGGCFYW